MKERLKELDSLRGIAALSVVMLHFTLVDGKSAAGFRFGVTGVDLFFIISGFVIIMTLNQISHWKEFVIGRISRLYPSYWTCVTITTAFMFYIAVSHPEKTSSLSGLQEIEVASEAPAGYVFKPEIAFIKYLANLTMFQHCFGVADIDAPYWTLIVELMFYLFMLACYQLKLLKNINIIGAMFLILILAYHFPLQSYFPNAFMLTGTWIPLVNHFALFFAGILFYQLYTGKKHWSIYVLIPVSLAVQTLVFSDGGSAKDHIGQMEYMIILLFYFAIFLMVVYRKLGFIIQKPLLILGAMSYPLYLIHNYLGQWVLNPFLVKHLGNRPVAVVVTLIIILFITSIITYEVDIPGRKYFRKILSKWWLKKEVHHVSDKAT